MAAVEPLVGQGAAYKLHVDPLPDVRDDALDSLPEHLGQQQGVRYGECQSTEVSTEAVWVLKYRSGEYRSVVGNQPPRLLGPCHAIPHGAVKKGEGGLTSNTTGRESRRDANVSTERSGKGEGVATWLRSSLSFLYSGDPRFTPSQSS